MVPMLLPGYLFLRQQMKRNIQQNRELLLMQFRECILAMAAALKAGYGIENALTESAGDMRKMFGERAFICRELEQMERGMGLHIPLEEHWEDLGKRSGQADIGRFAQIFRIARQNGGNLSQILQSTSEQISSNIEAHREAMTILSGRQMEHRIMSMMPLGILLYVEWTTPGYFGPLYHNLQGILIMTGCLGGYLMSVVIGERMLDMGAC